MFYGTRIKSECSIPYVITRFDRDHLDRMSHSERTVHIIWPLSGKTYFLTFPKNSLNFEHFVKINLKAVFI